MTMFNGYEQLDLSEAIIKEYEMLLNLFVLKIDELKKIFTDRQIQLIRQLIQLDLNNANHDKELYLDQIEFETLNEVKVLLM